MDGGDYAITKKILSTASQTGSTRDLRLLLNDALALTEKLDSVSASVGRGTNSASYDHQRFSGNSVFLKSPGAYSETGSMFRAQSLGNGLDSDDSQHYETSASFSIPVATPTRKNAGVTKVQNGYGSPPSSSSSTGTPSHHRRSSPLLNDKRSSSGDYASSPKSGTPLHKAPPSVKRRSAGQEDPLQGESGRNQESRGNQESCEDAVDVGLDCIAQLEALEKELKSYKPTEYPQRNSREYFSSSQDSSQEGHYEVDPHYTQRAS